MSEVAPTSIIGDIPLSNTTSTIFGIEWIKYFRYDWKPGGDEYEQIRYHVGSAIRLDFLQDRVWIEAFYMDYDAPPRETKWGWRYGQIVVPLLLGVKLELSWGFH